MFGKPLLYSNLHLANVLTRLINTLINHYCCIARHLMSYQHRGTVWWVAEGVTRPGEQVGMSRKTGEEGRAVGGDKGQRRYERNYGVQKGRKWWR